MKPILNLFSALLICTICTTQLGVAQEVDNNGRLVRSIEILEGVDNEEIQSVLNNFRDQLLVNRINVDFVPAHFFDDGKEAATSLIQEENRFRISFSEDLNDNELLGTALHELTHVKTTDEVMEYLQTQPQMLELVTTGFAELADPTNHELTPAKIVSATVTFYNEAISFNIVDRLVELEIYDGGVISEGARRRSLDWLERNLGEEYARGDFVNALAIDARYLDSFLGPMASIMLMHFIAESDSFAEFIGYCDENYTQLRKFIHDVGGR